MSEARNNESKLKTAGLRMALKLLPPDILEAAPRKLEEFLTERLRQVEPVAGEAGTGYLIIPAQDGQLSVHTATFDEQNTVQRIVSTTTLTEIFNAILSEMQNL